MEYPKIDTLWKRDPQTHKVILGDFRFPEFDNINLWLITEKIDGTNVRVHLQPGPKVTVGGRTDEAQFSVPIYERLTSLFPIDRVVGAFDPDSEAMIFGEAYGPKIQSGGVYRKDISVRIFDVAVLTPRRIWWLNWEDVEDVAHRVGLNTVPVLATQADLDYTTQLLWLKSRTAQEEGGSGCIQEGIVARTNPLLLMRTGQRVMWKLKRKDLEREVKDEKTI